MVCGRYGINSESHVVSERTLISIKQILDKSTTIKDMSGISVMTVNKLLGKKYQTGHMHYTDPFQTGLGPFPDWSVTFLILAPCSTYTSCFLTNMQ